MPHLKTRTSRAAAMLPANLRFLRRVPPAFTSSPSEDIVQAVFLDALHAYPPGSKLRQREPAFGSCTPSRCRLIAAYIQRKIGVAMPIRQVMQSLYELESRTQISKLSYTFGQDVTLAINTPSIALPDPSPAAFNLAKPQEDELVSLPCLPREKPSRTSTGSMSQRRQALNIPTLQRQLSIARYRSASLLSEASRTPITPLDQVLHTPSDPPQLLPAKAGAKARNFGTPTNRAETTRPTPNTPLRSTLSRASESPTISSNPKISSPDSLSPLVKSFSQRMSMAAPMHLPRRLSYSRAALLDTQMPVESPYYRNLHSPREPLASPLCIQGSVSDRTPTEFFSSTHASHIRCC
ncbi:hypothetical protein BD626DRAFT_433764 [Schizophyllum amplum]|uniref:Uncharacterized protein n=1 Tax=Schizophyllum amplum TaxID=97359 RepID=A0A550CAE1_9AGAR|nr:hypothetical protein BD626DRAFT_433764 [Auriculariopsis ampla]